jgi:hypothetical protein
MNYDQFRTLWHEALGEAGLMPFSLFPSETVDIRRMSRAYRVLTSLRSVQQAGPFHITTELSWKWDACLSARAETTEEDLLIEILGQDGYYLVTEQPWMRVDVTLRATAPMDAPLPMPDSDTWRHWAAAVTQRLSPLLYSGEVDEEADNLSPLAWCGEPTAQLRCDSEGRLYLTGVELPAWQGIDLPRQWDNPDRSPDGWPDVQLADFASRLRRALEVWEDCLEHLYRRK